MTIDKLAELITDNLGESIADEALGESNIYNWWLQDMTTQDLVDFITKHKEEIITIITN